MENESRLLTECAGHETAAALAELCYSGRGWKEGRRRFNEGDDGLDMISLPCVWCVWVFCCCVQPQGLKTTMVYNFS